MIGEGHAFKVSIEVSVARPTSAGREAEVDELV